MFHKTKKNLKKEIGEEFEEPSLVVYHCGDTEHKDTTNLMTYLTNINLLLHFGVPPIGSSHGLDEKPYEK